MAHIWQSAFWPNFIHDPQRTEAPLAAAMLRLGVASGLHDALLPDDRATAQSRALATEATASFAVEGARFDASQIDVPGSRAAAVAAMLRDAREGQGAGQEALTADRLHHWHTLLFHGITLDEKAQWRRDEIEIVRPTATGAELVYIPPPPERVPGAMAVFLDWVNAPGRTPAPIRAALAHLWFDTIQPYSDGNGRIGRAIVDHVLAGRGPLSVSARIAQDRPGYYAALDAGRRERRAGIDGTDFVLWFLDHLHAAARSAETDARFMLARDHFLRRFPALPPRTVTVLNHVFAQGPDAVAQGLSAAPYARIAGVSPATATRDLTELEAMGALRRGPEGGRSTRYLLVL